MTEKLDRAVTLLVYILSYWLLCKFIHSVDLEEVVLSLKQDLDKEIKK